MRLKRYLAWLLAALLMVSPALAEATLEDEWPEITAEAAQKAAVAALEGLNPIDDARATAWYRKEAGAVVVKRAICRAAGVACE